jgi:flagellar transcriptional activator FlhD
MMKIASATPAVPLPHGRRLVWNLLTSHGKGAANDGTSAACTPSILMAGRHQEAA